MVSYSFNAFNYRGGNININELISELEEVREEHGNQEIALCKYYYGDVEPAKKDEFFEELIRLNTLIV